MKKIIGTIILLLFFTGRLCNGQATQTPADSKPASSNVNGAEYPRVTSDLKVIFRIKAPDAQKIQIKLEKTYDMDKDDQGIWTLTTDPQVPGFHYYFLIVDGVQVSDPASESFFGWARMASGIEIPEQGVDYYTIKNVPHGFHLALLKAGIKHVYYESPGTEHEWLTWRRDLYDFAPRLFSF